MSFFLDKNRDKERQRETERMRYRQTERDRVLIFFFENIFNLTPKLSEHIVLVIGMIFHHNRAINGIIQHDVKKIR